MKNRLFPFLLFAFCFLGIGAQTFINLTPRPVKQTVTGRNVTLPAEFSISYEGISDEMAAEVRRFSEALNAATGLVSSVVPDDATALVHVEKLNTTAASGNYTLTIDNDAAQKVVIRATDALGTFYALQSVKKILPANVLAGVNDPAVKEYVLPGCSITDGPRFAYRGFMLDVARHFFTVEEVKRMLDVMSYYKMNRFHWHLSDDQGWRVEIKKYPRLTTVGATAPNSYFTEIGQGAFWINRQYGPFFYTQEQIKDVVAYARERHIEIIPEIDMPGHFVAALAAYPEYGCNPSNPPSVWVTGGISSTVMNVANPAAVQFAKDILAELMEIFPYEYMHIGGDECPTSEWAGNAECQALKKKLGFTSDRQLQSHFIKQMGDFVKEKGRKLIVWNEAITADGADVKTIKETGATVFCWQPAAAGARKAAELGLDNVYTPWGPYYINRQQSKVWWEESLPGDGSDHVQRTYNEEAVPANISTALAKHYTGVQGTFWTEHVGSASMMEYLALPRLMAIAECGWTQKSRKDFADFRRRFTADTLLFDYGNYHYNRDYLLGSTYPGETEMVMPETSTATSRHYYRIVTRASDERRERCWELLAAGSPLIAQYQAYGAAEGVLWTNRQAAEGAANYDRQWWAFEEDPANPGRYALVNKSLPEGSIKAQPSQVSTNGQWSYDATKKHYAFLLGEAAYGEADGSYFYTFRSANTTGQYMNHSMGGKGYKVNLYGDPNSGNGGVWSCVSEKETTSPEEPVVPFDYLKEGCTYRFTNAVEGYNATTLADNGTASLLTHSSEKYAGNAWIVEEPTVNEDGSQNFKLKNAATGRYIGTTLAYVNRFGHPVTVNGTAGARLTLSYQPETDDYRLAVGGHSLFPISSTSATHPGSVSAGSTVSDTGDAIRPAGAAWTITEVVPVTFRCIDLDGKALGTFVENVAVGSDHVVEAPALKNLEPRSYAVGEGEATVEAPVFTAIATAKTVTVAYERTAYNVQYVCRDERGAYVALSETSVPVGESYTVKVPEQKYFTLVGSVPANGTTEVLADDLTVEARFSTTAHAGVKAVGGLVTEIEPGCSYLIYDATTADGRSGYRNLNAEKQVFRTVMAEGALPGATWTLQPAGKAFKVKNDYAALYVPRLTTQAVPVKVEANGEPYTFTLNSDGSSWRIQGTNNVCWDGLASGALVGWNAPGHPYKLYNYFVEPYFDVVLTCVDEAGEVLYKASVLAKAGDVYNLVFPTFPELSLKQVEGNEGFEGTVEGHLDIRAVYGTVASGIGNTISAPGHLGIYDLQGRKLERISRQGVYIVNGKKVVMK